MIGTFLAIHLYPPVMSCWWVVYVVAALFVIPAAIVFLLDNCDKLMKYAFRVRLMMVLAASTVVMLAVYFYFNGALDEKPSVETQAIVSYRLASQGKYSGTSYVLRLVLSLNGEQFEDDFRTTAETFEATKQGDIVRVLIHPGEFSLPWYSHLRR
jgi:hypothetical protein